MLMNAAAPFNDQEFHAQAACNHLCGAVAPEHQSAATGFMSELLSKAKAKFGTIPWAKVLAAFMIAAQGGFSPEAIAAAFLSIFGTPTP